MKQLALDIGIRNQPRLDQVDSLANPALTHFLHAWLSGVGSKEHDSTVPAIYVWGAAGSGKSHLLRALSRELDQRGLNAGWMDAQTEQASHWSADWCAGLLDAVDNFSPVQQEAAFQWFVDAQTHQRPMIATGRCPPADLQLRDDLRSRIGWGEVFLMQPPQDERRRLILRSHAKERGLELSPEVTDYLLTRFSRDLGHLVALVDQMDRYAMQQQRPITIPLIKSMMSELEG